MIDLPDPNVLHSAAVQAQSIALAVHGLAVHVEDGCCVEKSPAIAAWLSARADGIQAKANEMQLTADLIRVLPPDARPT